MPNTSHEILMLFENILTETQVKSAAHTQLAFLGTSLVSQNFTFLSQGGKRAKIKIIIPATAIENNSNYLLHLLFKLPLPYHGKTELSYPHLFLVFLKADK